METQFEKQVFVELNAPWVPVKGAILWTARVVPGEITLIEDRAEVLVGRDYARRRNFKVCAPPGVFLRCPLRVAGEDFPVGWEVRLDTQDIRQGLSTSVGFLTAGAYYIRMHPKYFVTGPPCDRVKRELEDSCAVNVIEHACVQGGRSIRLEEAEEELRQY